MNQIETTLTGPQPSTERLPDVFTILRTDVYSSEHERHPKSVAQLAEAHATSNTAISFQRGL